MTPYFAAATFPNALALTAQALGRAGRGTEGVPLALRAVQLWEGTQILGALAMVLRTLGEHLYGDDHAAEARDGVCCEPPGYAKHSDATTMRPTAGTWPPPKRAAPTIPNAASRRKLACVPPVPIVLTCANGPRSPRCRRTDPVPMYGGTCRGFEPAPPFRM